MAQNLSEKIRRKRFIRNIDKKHFYEIYEFAKHRSDLTNEEKNIIVGEMIKCRNNILIEDYVCKFSWLTKENIDLLTKTIANMSDPSSIINFALNAPNLSKENLDILTEAIAKIKHHSSISYFANKVPNLSVDNISLLTNATLKGNNADDIYEFAKKAVNLSEKDKTNLVKGIVKTNDADTIFDFADNIGWLTDHHMDLLIEGLKNTQCAYYINEFTDNLYNRLTKKNIDTLLETIISTEEAASICRFAQLVELTKENKDKLTTALVDLKDAKYISEFAIKIKNLTKDNINDLAKAIVKTDSSENLYKFLVMVPKLSKENCELVLDRLFKLKDFDVIKLLIGDYLVGAYADRIGSDLENRIIGTKDRDIIAFYLFGKEDENLIKQFFGTKEKFILFICVNKSKLGIHDNNLEELEKSVDFKYVDANVNQYLGNMKVNKKY